MDKVSKTALMLAVAIAAQNSTIKPSFCFGSNDKYTLTKLNEFRNLNRCGLPRKRKKGISR